MPADTSMTDGIAKWILLREFPSYCQKIRKSNRGRALVGKTAVIFLGIKRDLVHCISKVYVLSTKWCSLLLYSLTSPVYAKLITAVYILALWVLQCEFSPHPQSVYSRIVSGSRVIATKSSIYINHMGILPPTCILSFQMQKKNELDETVIN